MSFTVPAPSPSRCFSGLLQLPVVIIIRVMILEGTLFSAPVDWLPNRMRMKIHTWTCVHPNSPGNPAALIPHTYFLFSSRARKACHSRHRRAGRDDPIVRATCMPCMTLWQCSLAGSSWDLTNPFWPLLFSLIGMGGGGATSRSPRAVYCNSECLADLLVWGVFSLFFIFALPPSSSVLELL